MRRVFECLFLPNRPGGNTVVDSTIVLFLVILFFLTPFKWYSHIEESGTRYITGWRVQNRIVPTLVGLIILVYLGSFFQRGPKLKLLASVVGSLGSLFLLVILLSLYSDPISGSVMVGDEFVAQCALTVAVIVAVLGSLQAVAKVICALDDSNSVSK